MKPIAAKTSWGGGGSRRTEIMTPAFGYLPGQLKRDRSELSAGSRVTLPVNFCL